jgi:integrase/recombinase XerD
MNKVNATVSLFLDTRRANKEGQYPISLRVSYRSNQWAVSLRMYATKEDYTKAVSEKGRLSGQQRELKETLSIKKQKALDVLNSLKSITKDTFNKYFLSEIDVVSLSAQADIKSQFEAYQADLLDDNRVRSAEWYGNALKSFLSFRSNCELQMVDEEYLRKYEAYMSKRGCSRSTTKMYLEAMRRIFNVAIKKGTVNIKYYPFKEYTIKGSVKAKKALMPPQVKLLWEAKTFNDTQVLAKDMWFMSYLCQGANNMDLMRLKWKDISGDKITFTRSKTSRTAKTTVPIVVHIHPEVKAIIQRHGNKLKGPNDWVFPVLNGCTTEAEIVKTVRDWRRHVNRCLNRMGKRLGFDFLLSISLARPSFATALKLKGTPVAVIGDMLGHTSSNTTEHYLSSITDDMTKSITSTLLDFNTLKAV